MTATQAPTPGPLSVGNLHTAIMEALAEDIQRQRPDAFREEDENGFEGDVIIPTGATPQSAFAKVNVSDLAEIILPLVAPTALVEASGSERERLISVMRDHIELGEIGSCSAEIVGHEEAADAILALRPQPSGETREAVARIVDPSAWKKKDEGHPGGENFVKKSLRLTDRILAFLSARPLTLGGQQGGALESVSPEGLRARANMVRDALNDGGSCARHLELAAAEIERLSTTPARAEAQDEQPDITPYTEDLKGLKAAMQAEALDEGAAGDMKAVCHHAETDADPVVSMLRDINERLDRPEPDLHGARVGVHAVRLAVSSRLLAHPSPTPAADADRVREAMRELIDADKELAVAINFAEPTENNDALTTAEYRAQAARNQAEQALSALKSTAAKEGEKS
ncbi:MAG: hypothetical protein WC563_10365 [Brevundimonas sp.]|jgi:hypothetical protein